MSGDLYIGAANAGLAVIVLMVVLLLLFRVGKLPPARDEGQLRETFTSTAERIERVFRDETRVMRGEAEERGRLLREEVGKHILGFGDSIQNRVEAIENHGEERFTRFGESMTNTLKEGAADIAQKIVRMTESNELKQEGLRLTVEQRLDRLRDENAAKLDEMRRTVDEKLQSTLERRLGESFKVVSERLEMVHKGLGEMQTLATGVGDLKRALMNVKLRGGWAEVQLGSLLEQMLTPEQFGRNVRIKQHSQEVVDYAIRLPGQDENGSEVFLPVDAKFPHEDYDRLINAMDRADADAVDQAGRQLELRIKAEAKKISEKYIEPPATTDFAILFLPTEGLFAEIIRRPGLVEEVQRRYRVMVTGPTTLGALLSSLQMGFRTLAIQKRSSEVWKVLGEAKTEFMKYGAVWDKVKKQLHTVTDTVEEAGRRTRAVERKLRDVETLEPLQEPAALIGLSEDIMETEQA